jgi:hypothetical protein
MYAPLDELLAALGSSSPDAPFEQLLAALRMSAHLSAGQPAVIYLDQLTQENSILQQFGAWAGNESRTDEELGRAIDQLTAHFQRAPWLPEVLIADHLLVADALRGNSPSLALAEKPESQLAHLADLANQLPWERERALLALNAITLYNVRDAGDLYTSLPTLHPHGLGSLFIRRWLKPRYADAWLETWLRAQPAAATSYLMRLEYQARSPVHEIYRAYCNNQTFRRAAILQIALVKYRRDHGAYPAGLSELVPDYLDQALLDPFSGQPFVYRAAGLDLPLHPGHSSFTRIEANTPLFWSVGAGDARPKQQDISVASEADESDPQGQPQESREAVYMLDSDDLLWSSEPAFAFPLPK